MFRTLQTLTRFTKTVSFQHQTKAWSKALTISPLTSNSVSPALAFSGANARAPSATGLSLREHAQLTGALARMMARARGSSDRGPEETGNHDPANEERGKRRGAWDDDGEENSKEPSVERLKQQHLRLTRDLEYIRLAAMESKPRKLNPDDIQDRLMVYEMDKDEIKARKRSLWTNVFFAAVVCPLSTAIALPTVDMVAGKLAIGAVLMFASFQGFIRAVREAATVTSIEMIWADPESPSASNSASAVEDAAKHAAQEHASDEASKAAKGSPMDEVPMTEFKQRKAHYAQVAEQKRLDEEALLKQTEKDGAAAGEGSSTSDSGVVPTQEGVPSLREAMAQKQRKDQDSSEDAKVEEATVVASTEAQSEKDESTSETKAEGEEEEEEEDGGLPDHIIIRRVARSMSNENISVVDLRQVIYASSHPPPLIEGDFSKNDLDRARRTHPDNGFVLLLSMQGIPLQCYYKHVTHDEAFLQLIKAAEYNFKYLLERGNALYRERTNPEK